MVFVDTPNRRAASLTVILIGKDLLPGVLSLDITSCKEALDLL